MSTIGKFLGKLTNIEYQGPYSKRAIVIYPLIWLLLGVTVAATNHKSPHAWWWVGIGGYFALQSMADMRLRTRLARIVMRVSFTGLAIIFLYHEHSGW